MELHLWLDDVEKLRRYAQFAASKNYALEDGLGKAKARSKHWERKAKEGVERITGVEKEGDEAEIARPDVVTAGDAKAHAEMSWLRFKKP